MSLNIPLTAITTLTGAAVMGYAWAYLKLKTRIKHKVVWRSTQFMREFFLHMMIFFVIMSIPYIWVNNQTQFSESAAWAYVVGHVFMYLGLMYISRMTFALIPRISSYDKLLTVTWLIVIILQTAFNAKTMIWGVKPTFDRKLQLTEFHTYVGVGIILACMALIAFVPPIILFIMNAIKTHGANRIKPILMSIGFLLITTAGPLHDNARSAHQYAFADIFTTIGMIFTLLGVAYHIQSSPIEVRPVRSKQAPSNTL